MKPKSWPGLAGHPDFTETIWKICPAQSGKDILLAFLQSLAGVGEEHFVSYLHSGIFVQEVRHLHRRVQPFPSASRRHEISHNLRGTKRGLVYDCSSPLTEQREAQLPARGQNEAGSSFAPSVLPLITSNFAPNLTVDERADSAGSG